MELTIIEQKLWDYYKEAILIIVDDQIKKMPQNTDPMTGFMFIESSIDMFIAVYSKLPHPGISNDRAIEILGCVAYLIKENVLEIFKDESKNK